MARIALGITLALLLATCYFGFSTRTKVEGLNDKIAGLSSELSSTQQRLAKSEADFKTSQDNLAKETADDEQTKSQLATVQSSLDAANAQVTTLNAKIDDLTKKLIAAGNNPNPQPQNNNGPTQAQMDALTDKLKDAQSQVAELTQLKETLTNKVKDAESRADDLQKVVDHYKNGTLRNGLEGEVLAVNQGWNFVVLSIGDRQGAVANAEMILKRGGSQIGKVRITSVEPSTSVADIIPGSLAKGVRVQPGDRVIFPGS
jgi:predicted  nucleic acid-binding Zn-ribbon protein